MATLYLGTGDHWRDNWTVGRNYGQTDLRFRWWTQTVLKIRAGRLYPGTGDPGEGTATHLAYVKVWDGSDNYDSNPANWRFVYDGVESGGWSESDPVALSWYAAVIDAIETETANDPMSTGRIHQLDDETMHLGWMWGRRGQSTEISHYRHETRELIDAFTDFLLPYKQGLMDALRARWPGEEWYWYNIPFSPNKQPPYNNAWPTDSDEPPADITASEVDAEDALLLTEADWVDGHCYLQTDIPTPGPLDTRAERVGWMTGNLVRKKAIADSLGKPFVARYWAFRSPAYEHPGIDVDTEYEIVVEFFEACVAAGVSHASIDQGRAPFDAFAAAIGIPTDQMWRDYYVAAAFEAGFLMEAAVPNPDPGDQRHRPLGTCYRLPLMALVCVDPTTGNPANPGVGFGTSQTDPTIRRVEVWQVGVPGATGQLQLGGSVLYGFIPIANPDPGTIIGPRITAGFSPADPADPGGGVILGPGAGTGPIFGPGADPTSPTNPPIFGPQVGVPSGKPSLGGMATDQPGSNLPSQPGFTSGMTSSFMYNA